MGLLDVFRGKKQPPPQADAEPMQTPVKAKITSFMPEDAVGTLTTSDGTEVRFGRSACGI